MDLYPHLDKSRSLDRFDTLRMATAIHTVVRNSNNPRDPKFKGVYSFAQRMVEHIKSGRLLPHPSAHVHLLGIFKSFEEYDEGYAFWQWLAARDEPYVSHAVYGAAIELMAYGKIGALPDMENLYAEALKRFPGTFAEYHLSPNAIVPHRNQPVAMVDLPILLLQGITTARILLGEWKNAYLALDTALRLRPVLLPERFFEIFIIYRPLEEAYAAYLVACRHGIAFKPNHLSVLMKRLRTAMTNSTHLHSRLLLLRAIANAIYAYQQAGGELEGVLIGGFIRAFEMLWPGNESGADFDEVTSQYRDAVVSVAHGMVSQLLRAGMPIHPSLFTALISLAGSQNVPSLLQSTLGDAQTMKVELDDIGRRIVLRSAGLVGDHSLMNKYWELIVSVAAGKGEHVAAEDWVTFAKVCKHSDYVQYCRDQMESLEHTIPTHLKSRLHTILEHGIVHHQSYLKWTGVKQFATQVQELQSQINNIIAVTMSGQRMDLKKSPFYMNIDPTRKPLGTPEDFRTIYDEYTIDPHQPPQETETHTAPNGIPLDELRFQNWVSIVEMMDHAYFWAHRPQPIGPVSLDTVDFDRKLDSERHLPLSLDHLRAWVKKLRTPSPIEAPSAKPSVRRVIPPRTHRPASYPLPERDAPAPAPTQAPRSMRREDRHPLGLQRKPAPQTESAEREKDE